MDKTNNALCSILVFAVFIGGIQAQTIYPPIIKVHVTFYDFHADGSNPDFNGGNGSDSTRRYLMVDSILDVQKKPLLGPVPYYNCFIYKWFVPWTRGDSSIPVYSDNGSCNAVATADNDTAYKNTVIQDSLTFTYVPGTPGVYQYVNDQFFPLDGRGFGEEGKNHNYNFSMELHWEFTKIRGLKFFFAGSGDLWTFINNKRVIDIGGIHQTISDSIVVDGIAGLDSGKKCELDVFYCDRQSAQSSIRMTLGLVTACPCAMEMRVSPDSARIEAGDSISLIARIIDDTAGVRPEYNQYFTWSLIGDTNAGFLKTSHGATNTFFSKDSLFSTATLNIVVHFDDSVTTQYPLYRRYDTVDVIIRPQPNAIKNQLNNNRPLTPSVSHNEEITLYSLTGKRVRPLYGLSANRVFNGSEAGLTSGVYFIVDKNNSNRVLKKIHY